MEASDFNVDGWGFELAEMIRENPDHWMNYVEHQWWPEDTGESLEVKETLKQWKDTPGVSQTIITYSLQQTALESPEFVGEEFDEGLQKHIKKVMFQNAEWLFQEYIKHKATELLPRGVDVPEGTWEIPDFYPWHFISADLTEKPVPPFVAQDGKYELNATYAKASYEERVFLHPESMIFYTPVGIGVDKDVQGPICSLGSWYVYEAYKEVLPSDTEFCKYVCYDPARFYVRTIFTHAMAPNHLGMGAIIRTRRDGQEQS